MIKSSTVKAASEKMINIHKMVILSVCIVFGVINIISWAVVPGIAIVVAGIIVPIVVTLMKNSSSTTIRGIILTQVQGLIIGNL